MMVDFKDEDYDMEMEKALLNSPMFEETVPLMKKHSYKMERGLSLFEEQPDMFTDDFKVEIQKISLRERSYSKFTENEWYRKEWKNHVATDQSNLSAKDQKFENIVVEESEYFKKLDSVLVFESQEEENVNFPVGNSEEIGIEYQNNEFPFNFSDLFKTPIEEQEEFEENGIQFGQVQNEDEDILSKILIQEFSNFHILPEPSCF